MSIASSARAAAGDRSRSGRRRAVVLALLAVGLPPAHLPAQVHLTLRAQASLESLHDPAAIVAAAVDGAGDVFILDDRGRITMTDRRLAFKGTFGILPEGRRAFEYPVGIGVLRDGRVAVLDASMQHGITLLRLESGRLTPEHTIPLVFFGRAMCVLRDNTFLVFGANQGMRLHIVSLTGRILRSFAPADSTLDWRAQDQFAMGRIVCDQTQDEVLMGNAWFPAVEAYRISTGRLTWVDTLRPHRPVDVAIQHNGLSIHTGPGGHSVVVAALIVGGCRFLQTRYLGRQDRASADTVLTYLFRGPDAAGAAVERDVPLLVPLGGSAVLSLSATEPEVLLQEASVDGCRSSAASP